VNKKVTVVLRMVLLLYVIVDVVDVCVCVIFFSSRRTIPGVLCTSFFGAQKQLLPVGTLLRGTRLFCGTRLLSHLFFLRISRFCNSCNSMKKSLKKLKLYQNHVPPLTWISLCFHLLLKVGWLGWTRVYINPHLVYKNQKKGIFKSIFLYNHSNFIKN